MQQHSFDLVATSMLHSTFSVPCANWKPTGVSEMFAMRQGYVFIPPKKHVHNLKLKSQWDIGNLIESGEGKKTLLSKPPWNIWVKQKKQWWKTAARRQLARHSRGGRHREGSPTSHPCAQWNGEGKATRSHRAQCRQRIRLMTSLKRPS